MKIWPRKRTAAVPRVPWPCPERINQLWTNDNLAAGRRIRLLSILDALSKKSLVVVVDTSINGIRVFIQELDYLGWMRALPEVITVDNGPEYEERYWTTGLGKTE